MKFKIAWFENAFPSLLHKTFSLGNKFFDRSVFPFVFATVAYVEEEENASRLNETNVKDCLVAEFAKKMGKQQLSTLDVAAEAACLRRRVLGMNLINVFDINPKATFLHTSLECRMSF